MSGIVNDMKDAVKGQNSGGLQSISQTAGEALGNSADTRSGDSKKSDEASSSLGDFAKGGLKGETTQTKAVSGEQQAKNQQTGTSDHLELGMRKKT